jgi:hypothetical protein
MSDPLLLAKPDCPGCGTATPIHARTRTCHCRVCGRDFTPAT